MSDQEFELEKEIANVSQLKSFANFKNNYNKRFAKQPEQSKQPQRQIITKSNQKLSNNSMNDYSNQKDQDENKQERKVKITTQQPEPSDFTYDYPQRNQRQERQYYQKQRSTQQTIIPKPRQRNRQFSQGPSYQHSLNTSLSHSQRQLKPLKQSIQPVIQQSFYKPTIVKPPTSVQQPSDSSYRVKFQQLSSVFEQFKNTSLFQKRKLKQQLFESEQTISRLKVRVYELQIHEDELIMQNKKLNQKLTKDFKTQKQSQSLKSILESRTEQLRRAVQQINYYRGQLEGNRKQLQSTNLDSQRYVLQLRQLRERLQYQQMEVENKERLQVQLSHKISGLIKQNAKLRDQVSDLFRTNKQLQYQNYSTKRQLKRGGDGNDSYNQYQKQQQSYNQSYSRVNKQEQSVVQQPKIQTKRRRGQFNQERNKINQRREVRQPKQFKQTRDIRDIHQTRQTKDPMKRQNPTTIRKQSNPVQQLLRRKDELQQQIGKMKEQKPMNGAMRRVKITLQQQLQQIIKKLSKSNE